MGREKSKVRKREVVNLLGEVFLNIQVNGPP